jgi:hypothetical protein
MRKLICAAVIGSLATTFVAAQDSLRHNDWQSNVFSWSDTLSYAGYTIVRSCDSLDESMQIWSVVILRNGKLIHRLGEGVNGRESCKMGLYPFLGGDGKQLLVELYSGGAHCCYRYWIIGFKHGIQVLYCPDEDDDLGGITRLIDLDGDRTVEFVRYVISFDYFEPLPHFASPYSFAVFKFSPAKNKYELSSKAFPQIILGDTVGQAVQFQYLFTKPQAYESDRKMEIVSFMVRAIINYTYAGMRAKGWSFFDRMYTLSDKEQLRQNIKKRFANSWTYKQLYSH